MPKEIVSLNIAGKIGSEMHGFQGKTCLKAAAEMEAELERLGVFSSVESLRMKDIVEVEQTQVSKNLVSIEGH